jgi:hypothetical protein
MASVFFHEDDYCQAEVLPAAARDSCLAEMDRRTNRLLIRSGFARPRPREARYDP